MDIGYDIKKLAQLLNQEEEDLSSDDDLPNSGLAKLGPGDIKQQVKVNVTGTAGDSQNENADQNKVDPKAIWQLYEVPEVPVCDDASYDPRERPEYEIKYRQFVSPEDLYLQLGFKTPATASCEVMVIIMKLNGESNDEIDLQVSKQHLDIRSPKYRLSLPLPQPVHPDKSSADWESDKSLLKVSLALNRELDLVNF